MGVMIKNKSGTFL